MIAAAELAAQRLLTKAFIDADYIPIALVRQTRVPDGAGGYTQTQTPVAAQRFRLVPQQDTAKEVQTADGRMVRPVYVLLGKYDCDMQRDDRFTVGGHSYRVAQVEDKQYEVKGQVVYDA